MNFKTVEISNSLRWHHCRHRKVQARPGSSRSYLCMRPCSVTVICIKYIGRSTQVMISESRAALHLCTCGNRATTDDGGYVATTAAATAAVAMAAAASSEQSDYYMSPRPPPPLRHCSAAAARHRRAYAVQYNVVTLRSEHIEYRSCPAH